MRKEQFSIYMDPSIREQIERIAAARGISLSALLEIMSQRLINSVDPDTWKQIEAIQKQIDDALDISGSSKNGEDVITLPPREPRTTRRAGQRKS